MKPPNRRDAQRTATRQDLLAAGARLFAERGVDGCSVGDVASAAGRTSGAIYDHFDSKQGLVFALVEEWAGDNAADTMEQLEAARSLDERLCALWAGTTDATTGDGLWLSPPEGHRTVTVERRADEIDLLDEHWERHVPFDQFDWLRRHDPVHWHPEPDGRGFWAVTRHADVQAVSRDSATFSSEVGGTLIADVPEDALAQMCMSILNMDPPRHARHRRIVARAFTPGVVANLGAEIDRRAVAVVDEVCEQGSCELVGDIAARVPIQTICQMIGLEDDEWPRMLELSKALVSGTDASATAAMDLFARCGEVAAQRRAEPRDDLTTALVQAEVDGDRLDDLEVCLFFLTLIVAGDESTRYLIANAAVTLMDHPDAAARLRAEPQRWGSAVEELLRWGASVHAFRRTASRPTELGGAQIAAGDKVVMFYLSANRDEALAGAERLPTVPPEPQQGPSWFDVQPPMTTRPCES